MSYGLWQINEDFTKDQFGYNSTELTKGSRKPVSVSCNQCGIKALRAFKDLGRFHRCKSIIDNQKKCFKCKQKLSVDLFSKNRSTADGYQKVCKECFANYPCVKKNYKEKANKLHTDIDFYLGMRAIQIASTARKKNIPCTISGKNIKESLIAQDFKCFYSDIPIKFNKGIFQFDSVSIDRKDPNLGYTKDNIVLCAFAINSFKGNLTMEEFRKLIQDSLPGLLKFQSGKQ
jgi:hypothetical protein